MVTTTATTEPLNATGLCRLLAWLSPNFPVGAFSYSHGLEFAVERELVTDKTSFIGWADGIIRFGSARMDAAHFRAAWEAVTAGDKPNFLALLQTAAALRGTSELALESTGPGAAFLQTLRRSSPDPSLDSWIVEIEAAGDRPSYAVAVALAAALEGVPLQMALTAFLHAGAANLVSAAVRLVPLGQTDGQSALAVLESAVLATAAEIMTTAFENIGTAALMVDWTSMQHETQYTRLFRS